MELEILLLTIFVSAFLYNTHKNKSDRFLLFATDDSDIKIAPNSFGNFNNTKELDSEDAELYLKHKQKGNIHKAHSLGRKIFEIVKEQKDEHNFTNKRFTDTQLKALCAFLAISKLDDFCPDSIIINSAKSVLYKEIRENLPEVYMVMNNNATYSVFLLNTSVTFNKDISFGKAFAEICSKQNDKEYIDFGINFYKKYSLIFDRICEDIVFE